MKNINNNNKGWNGHHGDGQSTRFQSEFSGCHDTAGITSADACGNVRQRTEDVLRQRPEPLETWRTCREDRRCLRRR